MPKLPRIGPGEVVPLRAVRPEDVGSGVGQAAYAGAAQDLGAISARLIGAEREAQVATAEVGYTAKLAEFAQTVDQNPDTDAREAQFEEGRKAIADEFRATLRGPQYQADFDQRAFQLGERAKLAVREGVIRRRLSDAQGGVVESVNKFYALAEHAESDHLQKGYLFAASNILDAGVSSGAISAGRRAELAEGGRRTLEDAALRRTSQQTAGTIFAEHATESARLKAARAIQDPQLLDLTVARIKDMSQEERLARSEGEQAQKDTVIRGVYGGELTHEKLQAMDLPAELRQAAENILAQKTARAGPVNVTTDLPTYYARKALMLDPRRRAEAEAYDLYQDAGKLSLAKFEQLQKWQRGEDLFDAAPVQAKLTQYKALLYKKRSPTAAEEKNALQYEERVENHLERERIRLGRQVLSDDELDAVLKSELRDVAVPGSWYGTNVVPAYKVNVPADAAIRLRAGLAAMGVPDPTADDLLEAYLDELEP